MLIDSSPLTVVPGRGDRRVPDRSRFVDRLQSLERRVHVRADVDAAWLYSRLPSKSQELARRVIDALADAARVERRLLCLPTDSQETVRGLLEELALKAVADARARLRLVRRSQDPAILVGGQ